MCSWAGDLSRKFGAINLTNGLTKTAVDLDPFLGWNDDDFSPKYGFSKLLGKSVVIHKEGGAERIACGQICAGSDGCDIRGTDDSWQSLDTAGRNDLKSSCSNLKGTCCALPLGCESGKVELPA